MVDQSLQSNANGIDETLVDQLVIDEYYDEFQYQAYNLAEKANNTTSTPTLGDTSEKNRKWSIPIPKK